MTKFSKVLTIFLTIGGLAFMGFAGVVSFAGRNWEVEARSPDLEEFQFSSSKTGEGKTEWSVKQILKEKHEPLNPNNGDDALMQGSSLVLPELILQARRKLLTQQNSRKQSLEESIQFYTNQLNAVRLLVGNSETALKAREEELVVALENLQQQVDTLSRQVVTKSQEAQARRTEAVERREDAFRLTNQLEIIRAEIFQIEKQQVLLRDLLYRLEGKVDIAQRTNDKLKQSDRDKPYD